MLKWVGKAHLLSEKKEKKDYYNYIERYLNDIVYQLLFLESESDACRVG